MTDQEIEAQGKKNRGWKHDRTKFISPLTPESPNLEKLFSEAWEKECKKQPGLNWGHGLLQDLFFVQGGNLLWPKSLILKVTNRERLVVATIVQWLGSNCGFVFLEQVLKKGGYKITKIGR